MAAPDTCVWHPMPEEVRRSSLQSRRASLAAGRRRPGTDDVPDWEVEVNAPNKESTTRNAAPPATVSSRVSQPQDTVAAPVDVMNVPEEQVADAKTRAVVAPATKATVTKTQKTLHTVRFSGSLWGKVLNERRESLRECFLRDLNEGMQIEASDIHDLAFNVNGMMVATFLMRHTKEDQPRIRALHNEMKKYDFPSMKALYPH